MNDRASAALLVAVLAVAGAGCAPAAHPGSLRPTLTVEDPEGARVAMQNGIPVPTFDRQPRRQIDLSGPWQVERLQLSADLSLTDREEALDAILAEAGGRHSPEFDDSRWEALDVPGALNHPPAGTEVGGWYRRSFYVPLSWTGQAATLKFSSANYVADVWVNGEHLGYHEGGYTPFAFDVSRALVAGERNLIAVRVDNPAWGTRNDIVPWGLADWWNYGGLTGPVWIEATPPTHLVRADVVPHLDAIDVSVVVRRSSVAEEPATTPTPAEATPDGQTPTLTPRAEATAAETDSPEADRAEVGPEPSVRVEVLTAEVTPENLESPVATALVADGGPLIIADDLPLPDLDEGGVARLDTAFLLGGADHWSPSRPALYVLHVRLEDERGRRDDLWTTFGLRHVAVQPGTAQLLLNGERTMFVGVGLHDERIDPEGPGELADAHRIHDPEALLYQLDHARAVNANLIRAGHTPANPLLLLLADRLGFAVWEEIPLYHYTPLTYGIAMDRGIPQQMLQEMALRDMNRPSVLFHGLSNESTGTDEREDALRTLHEVDRAIDGTRLTGQAAYGSLPDDPTHAPLDVAGFTFYYGVFYGTDAAADTARALAVANRTHPEKPILALEFGRWADDAAGPQRQARIFEETFPQLEGHSSARGGYVGAAVWWSLEDFATMVPGIGIEHFGLYEPSGLRRPAGDLAVRLFDAASGTGDVQQIESDVQRAEVVRDRPGPDLRLLGYLLYGLATSVGLLGALLLVLMRRGGRAAPAATRRWGLRR